MNTGQLGQGVGKNKLEMEGMMRRPSNNLFCSSVSKIIGRLEKQLVFIILDPAV